MALADSVPGVSGGISGSTLLLPQAPLNIDNFSPIPAIIGVVLVFGMKMIKERFHGLRNNF